MHRSKSSAIALGGLFVALTLIVLYSATFLKFNTLFLLGLTAAIIPLTVLTTDVKNAILVYLASLLLSYFILPDKGLWLLYAIIFGPYGIAKYYIESMRNIPLEIALKLLCYNCSTVLFFFIYKLLFSLDLPVTYSIILIVIVGNIAFFIFDYVLTVFIQSMSNRRFK